MEKCFYFILFRIMNGFGNLGKTNCIGMETPESVQSFDFVINFEEFLYILNTDWEFSGNSLRNLVHYKNV